jgi:hypothetical protein
VTAASTVIGRCLTNPGLSQNEIIRSLDCTPNSEGSFDHLFQIEGGLIVRMDIQNVWADC